MKLSDKVIFRFWNKVLKLYPYQCWPWQGATNPGGYGHFYIGNNIWIGAHQLSWWITHGRRPELNVLHTCDNPICVNPSHLVLGTPQDNGDDCIAKGRSNVGSKHGNSKLTEKDIEQIRFESLFIIEEELAKKWNVTRSNINHIVNRKTWNHV